MARIGCFSYSGVGHVSPLLSLARTMQQRGHDLTFFQLPDLEERIRAAGISYAAVGVQEMPVGSLARELREISRLEGLAAFERVIAGLVRECQVVLREAPDLIRKNGIEFLLVDESCDAAATVALTRGIPFVSLALALTRFDEPGIPFWGCPLPYSEDPALVAQYDPWRKAVNDAARPLHEPIDQERDRFGLPPISHVSDTHSKLATISQQPASFDFPRRELPATFHYTGPFLDRAARPKVSFPWERLDGRPLVYASLGTLQNRLPGVFQTIAEACAGLGVQLVMGLGGGLEPEELGQLPGDPLVVPYVPQPEMLERASVMITHAGMNSALECLAYGVPALAIPITHDQPNIAQRMVWTGTGTFVPLNELNADRLRQALKDVLYDRRYRQAARRFQGEIRELRGLDRAAGIAEEVLRTGQPVIRQTAARSMGDAGKNTPA
jgi:zeaxanthin glucosyltransferase